MPSITPEPWAIYAWIAIPFLAIIVVGYHAAKRNGWFPGIVADSSATPEQLPQPTVTQLPPPARDPHEGMCVCCKRREPTTYVPAAKYRWVDHATNQHSTRGYGLPPRPMVADNVALGKLLCAVCKPVCLRALETFLANQYARVSTLVAEQAEDAARFEGGGMFNKARELMGIEVARVVTDEEKE